MSLRFIRWAEMSKLPLVLALALTLGACSTTSGTADADGVAVYDPAEKFNRAMLSVNEGIDKVALEPVARGYRKFTPEAFRIAIRNFLRNLRSPVIIGNEILQGDLKGVGNAALRMAVNTLAGFGGILDLAAEGGVPYEPEDFGQTLGVWGVGHGPYLVLPLIGPSSARDATGLVVDSYLDPLRIYLFNIDREEWHYGRVAAGAIDKREELLDVIADLRKNSFDYYAALRSAYIQHRDAEVRDQDASTSAGPAIPEY